MLDFLNGAVFEPEVVEAMSTAVDEVCRELDLPATAIGVRGLIAKRVIGLARCGEHDPARLRDLLLGEASEASR